MPIPTHCYTPDYLHNSESRGLAEKLKLVTFERETVIGKREMSDRSTQMIVVEKLHLSFI